MLVASVKTAYSTDVSEQEPAEVIPTPAPGPRLRSNVAWMLAGNLWSGFTQWSLLVVLAKAGNIDMVGNFTLGLAIGLPVLMFSSLSLRSLQVTDCRRSYRFLEYLSLRLIMIVTSLLFVAGFGLIARYPSTLVISITLITAAKAIEYISDIFYGLLQQKELMAGIAISIMLRGTLSLCALSVGVYFAHSLIWGATGLVLASAVTLLAYDIPTALGLANIEASAVLKHWTDYAGGLLQRAEYKRLLDVAVSGIPLGLVLMLVSLNLNIPRYFIEQSLGIRDLAIFSSIANLMAAGSVATNALGQGAAPRLAKYFAAGDMRSFRNILSMLVFTSLALGAAGFGGALLFGPKLLAAIYRPEYSTRQDVLLFLMAASGFYYLGSTLGYAVTAVRCFTPQLPLFAVAAVTTAVACMVLVPTQGLRGAAIAILISAIVQCAGGAFLLQRACRRTDALATACA